MIPPFSNLIISDELYHSNMVKFTIMEEIEVFHLENNEIDDNEESIEK